MTPAQRAISCIAPGQLSGLPKWEWLPGMLYTDSIGRARRILAAGSDGFLVVSVHFGAQTIRLSSLGEAVPVLGDELTRHGLLVLIRRAWKGHEVRLDTDRNKASTDDFDRPLNRVLQHKIVIIAPDGDVALDARLDDLDALLVAALELAP